jgi:hypothetical protein
VKTKNKLCCILKAIHFAHNIRMKSAQLKFFFTSLLCSVKFTFFSMSFCGKWAWSKQKSYKCDRLRDSWLTGITRPAGSCNLVTLSTNFAQYKNFVWRGALLIIPLPQNFCSKKLSIRLSSEVSFVSILFSNGSFRILKKAGGKFSK